MKTFISIMLLLSACIFNVQAQQKTKQPKQQVVKRVIDVLPDGTRQTRETYASGTENTTTTKGKAPKATDAIHEEQNYDVYSKTFITTNKALMNGKVITKEMPQMKQQPQKPKQTK